MGLVVHARCARSILYRRSMQLKLHADGLEGDGTSLAECKLDVTRPGSQARASGPVPLAYMPCSATPPCLAVCSEAL